MKIMTRIIKNRGSQSIALLRVMIIVSIKRFDSIFRRKKPGVMFHDVVSVARESVLKTIGVFCCL
jgi:hypothetical protein